MIGNFADAARAVAYESAGDWDYLLSAEGTTRMVFLINGVVYKIDSGFGANVAEYENITAYRDMLPEGFLFPETSLFHVNGMDVIAMEYIEGVGVAACYLENETCDGTCAPQEVVDVLNDFHLDSGGMNVIINDSGYWIVDAA